MDKIDFNGTLIGCMPSSGSTLLSVLLDSHPDLVCGPELAIFCHTLLWNPVHLNASTASAAWFTDQRTDGVVPWSVVDVNNLKYYYVEKSEVINWSESSSSLFELSDLLFQRRLQADCARKWVEKTPQNLYALHAYLNANSKATAIILIRDPRAVIDSLIRRGVSPKQAPLIWTFEASIAYALITDAAISPRLQLLRYEDLISNPREVLSGLCQFLGVSENADLMMKKVHTGRLDYDRSLIKKEGKAANAWLCSPSSEISTYSLSAWTNTLHANVYDVLVHCSSEPGYLSNYVSKPGLLSATALMDYFGYQCQSLEYESTDNRYEQFYTGKVQLNSSFSLNSVGDRTCNADDMENKVKHPMLNSKAWIKKRAIRYKAAIKRRIKRNNFVWKHRVHLLKVLHLYRSARNLTTKTVTKAIKAKKYSTEYQWHEPIHSEKHCDLVVVTAFSGRHLVLKAVIHELFCAAESGLNISLVLACSDSDDLAFAKEQQLKYKNIGIVECDNNPLGNKWYIAVECARKLSANALMITGSDDIISSDYIINNYRYLMDDELNLIGMVGPRVWYMLDYVTSDEEPESGLWQLAYRNDHHRMPLGAGRIYSSNFLDRIDWNIFDRNLDALLDDRGFNETLAEGRSIYNPTLDDGFVISIKGRWTSMNPMDDILAAASITATQIKGNKREYIIEKIDDSLQLLSQSQPDYSNVGDRSEA